MAAADVSAPSPYHAGDTTAGIPEAWSDFPAWLSSRGVGPRAARALDSALGIGDYAALRACAEHAGLRAELVATARERLPFGSYAVLRRLVESFELVCTGDPAEGSGTARSRSSSLLDILVVLLTALSGELSRSALRLSALDAATAAVPSPAAVSPSNGHVSVEPRAGAVIQAADGSYLSDHDGMDEDQEELPLADDQQDFSGIPTENHGCGGIPGMHSGFYPGRECDDERHVVCAELPVSPPFERDAGTLGVASRAVKVEMDDTHADSVKDEDVGAAVGHRGGATRPGEWSQGSFVHEGGGDGGGGGGGGGNVDSGRQRWCHDDSTPGVWDSRWRHHHHHHHVQDGSPLDTYSAAPASCSTAAPSATSQNNTPPDDATAAAVRGSAGGTFVSWRGNGVQRPSGDRISADDGEDGGAAATAAVPTSLRLAPPHRPFVCTSCGKAFSKLAVLTLHVRTHTGERPYVCAQCGRAFAQASSLGYHRRTHTGEKPYACDGCTFRCARSSSLIRHQRACRRRNGGGGDDGGISGGDEGGVGGGIAGEIGGIGGGIGSGVGGIGGGIGGGISGVLRY